MKTQPKKLILRVLSLSIALMILFAGMPTGTNQDLCGFNLSVSAASNVDLSGVTMPTLVGGGGINHPGTISGGTGTITIAPQAGYTFTGDTLTVQVIGDGTKNGSSVASAVLTATAITDGSGNIVIAFDDTITAVTKINGISVFGVTENSNYALKLTNNGSHVLAALYSDAAMTTLIPTENGVFKPYAVGATVYVKIVPAAGYEITATLRGEVDGTGIEYDIVNYNSSAVAFTKQADGTYTGSFTTQAGDSGSYGLFISNVWEATAINCTLTAPTLTNATASYKKGDTATTTANYGDSVTMAIAPAAGYSLNALTADSFVVTGGTKGTYSNGVLTIANVTGNVTVALAAGVSSVVTLEEYDGTALPINGTILISDENITADQNITWTHKSEVTVDDTISYGDTVTIPVYAAGYTITGTPTVSMNGGGIQVTGAYANGNVTFTMPDIGNNNDSINLVEISGLATSHKSYDINYNKSAMKIYSGVAAPINGAVTLSGLPIDTDGTLAMQGDTGYYAEITPPAVGAVYDVTPKLFGENDPDGSWAFFADQPNITAIKDANGKTIGLYFSATPADMENKFSGEGMNLRFSNVVIPTHKVTYNGNGATGGTAPAEDNTKHQNDVITLAGNPGNLAKKGYTFGGWSLTQNGKAVTTYTIGTTDVTFYAVWTAIIPSAPAVQTAPTASNITVIGKLSSSKLTGGKASVPGTFSWTNPDTVITKSGNYEVTFTPTDTDHYSTVTCNVPVTVTSLLTDSSNTQLDLTGAALPAGVTSVSLGSTVQGSSASAYAVVEKLIGQNKKLGDLSGLTVYDLKLLDQHGKPIEKFKGKIKVKLPIPTGMSGDLKVFWYNPADGTLTDMTATQKDGYLVFETNHFSYYTIAQFKSSGTSSTTTSGSGASSSATSGTAENPKTGSGSWLIIPLALFLGSVAAGTALIKRRKMYKIKKES